MSFSHSFRNWLALGPFVLSSFTLLHCSSKDDDGADTSDGGSAGRGGNSAGKGGSVSSAGSSSAGKAGAPGTAGSAPTSAGSGGSAGASTAPECMKEADCGVGQVCTAGKCAVKPCQPPATAFQFKPETAATTVALAGSLNDWSATASPLALDAGSGFWKGTFELAAGTYQYKFVVDGATWLPDPANPDTVADGFCGFNSQITIGCDGVEPPQGVTGDACPPQGGAGGESSGGAASTGSGGEGGG